MFQHCCMTRLWIVHSTRTFSDSARRRIQTRKASAHPGPGTSRRCPTTPRTVFQVATVMFDDRPPSRDPEFWSGPQIVIEGARDDRLTSYRIIGSEVDLARMEKPALFPDRVAILRTCYRGETFGAVYLDAPEGCGRALANFLHRFINYPCVHLPPGRTSTRARARAPPSRKASRHHTRVPEQRHIVERRTTEQPNDVFAREFGFQPPPLIGGHRGTPQTEPSKRNSC